MDGKNNDNNNNRIEDKNNYVISWGKPTFTFYAPLVSASPIK